DAPAGAQAARHERRVVELRDADGHVEPLREEIDEAVVEDQLDLDVGVPSQERAHHRPDVTLAEAHRRADAETAARRRLALGNLSLRVLEGGEDALAAVVDALARPGRAGLPA